MSQDTKSPENLFLVGSLLLFVLLPFQNCTYSPISLQFTQALANEEPGFHCETQKNKASFEAARHKGPIRPLNIDE